MSTKKKGTLHKVNSYLPTSRQISACKFFAGTSRLIEGQGHHRQQETVASHGICLVLYRRNPMMVQSSWCLPSFRSWKDCCEDSHLCWVSHARMVQDLHSGHLEKTLVPGRPCISGHRTELCPWKETCLVSPKLYFTWCLGTKSSEDVGLSLHDNYYKIDITLFTISIECW